VSNEKAYEIHAPPVGKVQRHEGGFIEWEPGNGSAYRLIVQEIPKSMQGAVGGKVMVSVLHPFVNVYTSYLGNAHCSHVYTLSFVEEKFKERNSDLYCITALINWALFGVDSVGGRYAQETYDKARERWKF